MAKTERRECDVRGCNNIAIWCTDHMIEIENNVRKETVEAICLILDTFRTKHVHPRQPKLDYYDRWQSSGCDSCLINQTIKQIKNAIKKKFLEVEK